MSAGGSSNLPPNFSKFPIKELDVRKGSQSLALNAHKIKGTLPIGSSCGAQRILAEDLFDHSLLLACIFMV